MARVRLNDDDAPKDPAPVERQRTRLVVEHAPTVAEWRDILDFPDTDRVVLIRVRRHGYKDQHFLASQMAPTGGFPDMVSWLKVERRSWYPEWGVSRLTSEMQWCELPA